MVVILFYSTIPSLPILTYLCKHIVYIQVKDYLNLLTSLYFLYYQSNSCFSHLSPSSIGILLFFCLNLLWCFCCNWFYLLIFLPLLIFWNLTLFLSLNLGFFLGCLQSWKWSWLKRGSLVCHGMAVFQMCFCRCNCEIVSNQAHWRASSHQRLLNGCFQPDQTAIQNYSDRKKLCVVGTMSMGEKEKKKKRQWIVATHVWWMAFHPGETPLIIVPVSSPLLWTSGELCDSWQGFFWHTERMLPSRKVFSYCLQP